MIWLKSFHCVGEEIIDALRYQNKLTKKRKVDEELVAEITAKKESITESISVIDQRYLSNPLKNFIEYSIKENLITPIRDGTIPLSTYIDLTGFSKDEAVKDLTIIKPVVENRGSHNSKRINYKVYETLILPPKPLLKEIVKNKVVYHIATIDVGSSLPEDIRNSISDKNLFDKIIKIETASQVAVFGTW